MPKTSGLTSSQDSRTPFVRPSIRIRSSNSGEKAANRTFFARGVSSYSFIPFENFGAWRRRALCLLRKCDFRLRETMTIVYSLGRISKTVNTASGAFRRTLSSPQTIAKAIMPWYAIRKRLSRAPIARLIYGPPITSTQLPVIRFHKIDRRHSLLHTYPQLRRAGLITSSFAHACKIPIASSFMDEFASPLRRQSL
jgi:hypothetical protein